MRNIILAVILVLLLSNVMAQYFIVYADTIDFEEPCNYLFIDSSATNLWQMGIPGKTILDSAYSEPYAIITDKVNYYPPNNHSNFVLKLDPGIVGFISTIDISFWHKFDTDSMNDYGVVEVSYDTGNVWKVLRTDTTYINFIFFNRNGSDTATHLATGQSNGWLIDTYTFYSYLSSSERPENIWLRFSFYSDDIQDNREGWMIDDIRILGLNPGV